MNRQSNAILRLMVLVLVQALLVPLCVMAQTNAEIEARMDEIKLNEEYIFGEGSGDSKDTAYDHALADLTTYANQTRAEKGLTVLEQADLRAVAKELYYVSGSRHITLLYLTWLQMLTLPDKTPAVSVENKPAVSQSADTAATHGSRFIFVPAKQETPQPAPTSTVNDEITRSLSLQDNWIEIQGLLSTYKRDGHISAGKTMNPDEVPTDAYSILLDSQGGIVAILSPKNSAKRIDHKTGLPDSETNLNDYKFIVWYQLKL